MKSLCEHECKVSSVPININAKAKATNYSRGINFTLISVATVKSRSKIENSVLCDSLFRAADVRLLLECPQSGSRSFSLIFEGNSRNLFPAPCAT